MSKASDIELEFDSEIKNGNDLALSKLFDLYGLAIVGSLKRRYSKATRADDALAMEATNDAFWGYYRNPATFNPLENTLKRFLEIAAERDLQNILQKNEKYSRKQNLPDNVELEEKFWNSIRKDKNSADSEIIHSELTEIVNKELANNFDNEVDILLAKMVLSKEREYNSFAEILNIDHLPTNVQTREVKKHKDRIKKVLQRNQVESKLKILLQ